MRRERRQAEAAYEQGGRGSIKLLLKSDAHAAEAAHWLVEPELEAGEVPPFFAESMLTFLSSIPLSSCMAPRTNGASSSSRPQGGAESILPLFPLLSSHDPPTRLDASLSLLTALPALSASSTPASAEDADTPYAIKRLVTGLGSSNEASRQGFAVALTELLARLPADKAATVLPLILSTSTPTAGSESREERDLLFARLLGLHAVVRSGVLFRAEQPDGGESFKEVILALLALSGKKSWIREPAYWTLIESVRTLLELSPPVEWRDEIAAWVIQRLLLDSREKARGWNPEKIALVLVLQTYGVVSCCPAAWDIRKTLLQTDFAFRSSLGSRLRLGPFAFLPQRQPSGSFLPFGPCSGHQGGPSSSQNPRKDSSLTFRNLAGIRRRGGGRTCERTQDGFQRRQDFQGWCSPARRCSSLRLERDL